MNKREKTKLENEQKRQEANICIESANALLRNAIAEQWDIKKMLIQNDLVGVTTLKNRGWNNAMIEAIGEPDKLAFNPHYRSGPKRALYSVLRIADFEKANINLLKDNLVRRINRQQKLSSNPPKLRKPTAKQLQLMSDALCESFSRSVRSGNRHHTLYKDIKAAAGKPEPWSSVNSVLETFVEKYNAERGAINLDHLELRELYLGKHAVCSFAFYISDESGVCGAILDCIEFSTPDPMNSAMMDAVNKAAAFARAGRIKEVALASK